MEQAGQLPAAVQLYMKAGAPLQAARVVALQGRPGDAATMLLEALNMPLEEIPTDDVPRRRVAMAAAFYFIRGGAVDRAVEVLLALGERDRAIAALKQAGDVAGAARLRGEASGFEVDGIELSERPDGVPELARGGGATRPATRGPAPGAGPVNRGGPPTSPPATSRPPVSNFATTAIPAPASPPNSRLERARYLEREGRFDEALKAYVDVNAVYDAARMAYRLRLPAEAAQLLLEIQRYYEAAKCFAEARNATRALGCLLRLEPSHARYGRACVLAVSLAAGLETLPEALLPFLQPWLDAAEPGTEDIEAIYKLATVLDREGQFDAAGPVYEKVLGLQDGYRDAAERLRRLQASKSSKKRSRRRTARHRPASEPSPDAATAHGAPMQRPKTAPSVSFDPGPLMRGAAPAAATPPPTTVFDVPERPTGPTPSHTVPSQTTGGSPMVASPEELIAPGTIIDERYRVIAKIGEGASATVLRVHDLELGDDVAMKLFHMNFSDNDVHARRMKREIRVCRKLTHPNIIRLYDIGKYMAHRYLTMELLTGTTLKYLLLETIDIPLFLEYLAQASVGLDVAHNLGVVHRDVKPDNLFLTDEKTVKVMDFGIAKQRAAEGMTITGTILGTPGYMAPEQIDGSADVGAAADQYALGAVAYRLLTRTKVFEHPEIVPLLMMHATKEPDRPSTRNPAIPPELDVTLLKLLAKAPEERFESCQVVAEVFREIAADLS